MNMKIEKKTLLRTSQIVTVLLFLLGLYWISLYNYPLFHTLAELSSIVVAYGIFMMAWSSREFTKNNYLLFLGIAYLSVGTLDLFHTLTYKGTGIFPDIQANVPTQLWISARYMESMSLLISPLFLKRRLSAAPVMLIYNFITAFLLSAIFYFKIFPDCFIEGQGLTSFKIASEYIISVVLVAAMYHLSRYREMINAALLKLMNIAILLTIIAELFFTLYISVYGISNLMGHYFKIISFIFIYKAVIENGLADPYRLLFGDLEESREILKDQNEKLKKEIENRIYTEEELKRIIEKLQGEKNNTEESIREANKKQYELIQRVAGLTMKKSDAAREHAKLISTIVSLQDENEVLNKKLSYYLKLFEQAEGDISGLLKDCT